MSTGAQQRGVLGVIIDGRCRDLLEHRGMSFPVYARGHSTLGQGTFTRPSELNVPVTISPRYDVAAQAYAQETGVEFPSTTINPGDYLLADIDGVVCVPVGLIDQVVERCKKAREIDEKCVEEIKGGMGIQEAFKKWRG